MSSKISVPGVKAVAKETDFRSFVGARMSKNVKFMGGEVTINKLSVSEVQQIQEDAKKIQDDDQAGFEVLKKVIKYAVVGASDVEDEEFESFPLDELSKLSDEITKFSGFGEKK